MKGAKALKLSNENIIENLNHLNILIIIVRFYRFILKLKFILIKLFYYLYFDFSSSFFSLSSL